MIEDVLSEYERLIHHIINKHVRKHRIPRDHAQDIFQDVCVRLIEELPNYDEDRGALKTYVNSITTTTCMRYTSAYFKSSPHDYEIDEDKVAAKNDNERLLRDMIDEYKVPNTHRKIIHRMMDGYKQQEVAAEFEMSQSTVSRILSEFRDYLLESLK